MERRNEAEREKMKRKSGFFFVLILSFSLVIGLVFSINRINRSRINNEFKSITSAGGRTFSDLIGISGLYLFETGEKKLREFLAELYKNESIFYIGLKKKDELIYLLSRFEGYFPSVKTSEETRFISSPMGTVFEASGSFNDRSGERYSLVIGFDYHFLDTFRQNSGNFFLFILGVITVIFLVLLFLIIRYDRILYRKDLEYLKEKEERERLGELSMLTSEIAHEIKNPLNSIYLSFNSLDNYLDSSEEASFYRDAIKSEIRRISDIINSYSDLSREIEVRNSPVDLVRLTEEFKILKSPQLKEKGVRLETSVNPGHFITDRNLLMQILLNLTDNAVEAEADTVKLIFKVRKNQLVINVMDNGKEIENPRISQIFKPYESTKVRGMGLGLHIVMKNVKALRGSIEVISGKEGEKNFEVIIREGEAG